MIPYEYGLQKEAVGRLSALFSKVKPYLNPKKYVAPATILGLSGVAGIGALAYLGAGNRRPAGPDRPYWLNRTYNTGKTYGQSPKKQGIIKTVPAEIKAINRAPAKDMLAGPLKSEIA